MNDLKGIYLAACKARHSEHNIIYQDIDTKYKCDLAGDMLDIDISDYDFIIATPPCNWWSKANPYYKTSAYSLQTKHLLPDTIIKLAHSCKPFIIENVINKKRFKENGIYDLIDLYKLNVYYVGRHMYVSNTICDFINLIPQHQDFKYGGRRINNDGYNQGGSNVYAVIESWINFIERGE